MNQRRKTIYVGLISLGVLTGCGLWGMSNLRVIVERDRFVGRAAVGDVENMKRMMGKNHELLSQCGLIALAEATEHGHLETMEFLFQNGLSPEAKDIEYGHSMLELAVIYGHLEVVRYLMEQKGVSIRSSELDQSTALSYAVGKVPFREQNSSLVGYLLSQGAEINARNRNGRTALWFAAAGDINAVIYLIDQGAFLDLPDSEGVTPVMVAAECDHIEIVRYLIEHGADGKKRTATGENIAQYASAHKRHYRLSQELMAYLSMIVDDTTDCASAGSP